MVSCDHNNLGCSGGNMYFTWDYLENTGIVTDVCYPYVSGDGSEPPCADSCKNGDPWVKNRCKENSVVEVETADEIKDQLMTHGPMETGFMVFEDFMAYKSGIYVYTKGEPLGGHAVKMLGWGKEGDVEYWICANSWGEVWGDKGIFKIKFGEVNIDTSVWACTPDVPAMEQPIQ